MLTRSRRIAPVLLVILLAHLALMASPLHAAHAMVPAAVAHAGHGSHGSHGSHEVSNACDGVCDALTTLAVTPHAEAAGDCSLSPGPLPRPLRVGLGAAQCIRLDQLFPQSPAPALRSGTVPAWVSPAAACALLQVLRN